MSMHKFSLITHSYPDRTVNVVLSTHNSKKVFKEFSEALWHFPRLENLQILHIHSTESLHIDPGHQAINDFERAFHNCQLTSVRTLTYPGILPTATVLSCFPELRSLTVLYPQIHNALPLIKEYCPHLEYLEGHELLEIAFSEGALQWSRIVLLIIILKLPIRFQI